MHIGTFTPEGNLGGGDTRSSTELADARHHVIRDHAGGRFPGRFGWGYDGVDLFAPTRLYGAPDDLRALRRSRARRWARRDPRRRSTTTSGPDGNYLRAVRDATTSPSGTRTNGARRSTSTDHDSGPVARVLHRTTPHTGSTSFTSTACGSMRRSRSTTRRAEHVLAALAGAPARAAGGRAHLSSSPRTSRRRRGWCARATTGGYGLDAMWNDDFHHRAVVALTGTQRGLLLRLSRHAAGARLGGRKCGLPLSGPVVQWQKHAAGRRPSICRRARSSTFWRITIRSRTRYAACGCTSSPAPAAAGADRAAAARARHADAVSGPGVRRVDAVLSTSPTTSRSWPSRRARAGTSSSRQFPQPRGDAGSRPRSPTRATPRRRSSAASSIWAERERNSRSAVRLHRDLLRLRREDPARSPASRAASTARCSDATRFVLRLLRRRRRRRPAAARQPGRRPAISTLRRAAAGAAGWRPRWAAALVERRHRATAAAARRRGQRRADWHAARPRPRSRRSRPGR